LTYERPETDIRTRLRNVADGARGHTKDFIGDGSLSLFAYVAYCALDRGLCAESLTSENLIDVIDSTPVSDEHRATLRSLISDNTVNLFRSLMRGFSAEELRGIILRRGTEPLARYSPSRSKDPGMPPSIQKLVMDLLHIENDNYVADLHCGDGAFLIEVAEADTSVRMYGNSTNPLRACLAEVRMNLVGAEHLIECRNDLLGGHLRTFDRVFDAPPLGMRVAYLAKDATPYLKPLLDGTDPMGRPSSADWLYCRLAYDSLADGGTAVVIVANGATFNGGDIQTRRYFVENGMVRAAIALPERLLTVTTIPLTVLVLGRNDGPIRVVDATDLATPGRRTNTLPDDAISKIETRLSQDGDMSRLASREELAARDYSLYAPRYLYKTPDLVNPISLGDLAVSMERGVFIRASELDDLTTPEDTGFHFLTIADISDGTISDDLPHLKSVEPSTEKQWLRSGDLILSKNGAPFKVAVADVPDGRTILVSGNLYIIRLDTDRVDPYFVAAFLASEDGKRSLECMVVGTTIPNLPLRNLRNVQVPVPDMETQHRVAARYRADLDQIAVLKIRLNSARAALSASYDEEMGH
jgi:type I restriction enzyme M protein